VIFDDGAGCHSHIGPVGAADLATPQPGQLIPRA
jgi:hypothetical protein